MRDDVNNKQHRVVKRYGGQDIAAKHPGQYHSGDEQQPSYFNAARTHNVRGVSETKQKDADGLPIIQNQKIIGHKGKAHTGGKKSPVTAFGAPQTGSQGNQEAQANPPELQEFLNRQIRHVQLPPYRIPALSVGRAVLSKRPSHRGSLA
jgi:hypothetical protein